MGELADNVVRFPVERARGASLEDDLADRLADVMVFQTPCSPPAHVFVADEEICQCGSMWRPTGGSA